MKFRMSLKKLRANAAKSGKTQADIDRIIQYGHVEGDWLILDDDVLPHIYGKPKNEIHRPLPPEVQSKPELAMMAKQIGVSVWRWAKSGFKIVPDSVEQARLKQCLACQHWNAKGNGGLGKCNLCGCSRFKHKLPDERCPDNPPKWVESAEGKTL